MSSSSLERKVLLNNEHIRPHQKDDFFTRVVFGYRRNHMREQHLPLDERNVPVSELKLILYNEHRYSKAESEKFTRQVSVHI